MIQRIQSFYLFLSAIAMVSMVLFPFAEGFSTEGNDLLLKSSGLSLNGTVATELKLNTLPLLVLILIISLISLTTLFSYKNRIRQIRLSVYNLVLMIGLGFMTWFYVTRFAKLTESHINYKFPIILPAIAIILTFLAYKAIKKDEKLVRSIDRIR